MKSGHVVTRVAEQQWHAMEGDRVVGRGDTSRRLDGRTFLSVDAWHGTVFDRLAEAMLADLPKPLYTLVDETDLDLTSRWQRAGFTTWRREWEYVVPTTSVPVPPPPGVTMLTFGEAEHDPLRELDLVIRAEVEAGPGWHEMPAEVLPGPVPLDPSKYAVAAQGDAYLGLVRLGPVPRRPRIGLVAVRSDARRRGIARALLIHVLAALHRDGVESASAEVKESNDAALRLFEGLGARRASSNLELVLR